MIYQTGFRINYNTKQGQTVAVKITDAAGKEKYTCRLSSSDNADWYGDFELSLTPGTMYHYKYAITEYGKTTVEELACPQRELLLDKTVGTVCFEDVWRYDVKQTNYGRSALLKNLFSFPANTKKHATAPCCPCNSMRFTVCLLTPSGSRFKVVLTGENEALGNWNPLKGMELERISNYRYAVTLPVSSDTSVKYKYVIMHQDEVVWESGENRTASASEPYTQTNVDGGWIRIPRYTDWRGCGMVVPLFSIHTDDSDGIGDFADLKRLVEWCSQVGFSAVQLLPVNDTATFGTWRDSYPYNITSAFALNPVYISLKLAGYKKAHTAKTAKQNSVDYEAVFRYKTKILRLLYDKNKATLQQDAKYLRFKKENAFWLDSYAVYCTLRDTTSSLDFGKWQTVSKENPAKIRQADEFYRYVQYLAFSQMESVAKYARKKRVILKGDIPIGVNLNSAEVWKNPGLFNKDMSTGAPPDYFSEDGQNWGFPTYNWENMEQDGCLWWRKRLEVMSRFFDAYRIDHVLGFFRIWEIPRTCSSAKLGHFSPAIPYSRQELEQFGFKLKKEHIGTVFLTCKNDTDKFCPIVDTRNVAQYSALSDEDKKAFDNIHNDFYGKRNEELWEKGALKKLDAIINATDMMPCAEDLGMLPDCVESVLDRLGILSLEIQSMPKQSGREFADTSRYPYRSVATLTTHDMPSFRLWWKKHPDAAKRYAASVLGLTDNIPQEADSEICTKAVELHLKSPSMLCMLSFQDWSAICEETSAKDLESEQINNPANSRQYWRYKTHLSIEELEKSEVLSKKIRKMICGSQRDLFV